MTERRASLKPESFGDAITPAQAPLVDYRGDLEAVRYDATQTTDYNALPTYPVSCGA
jgi:hypothetical protein